MRNTHLGEGKMKLDFLMTICALRKTFVTPACVEGTVAPGNPQGVFI